jgi:hypothetical protein
MENKIRFCTIPFQDEWKFYRFHTWAQDHRTGIHPEDPRGDLKYAVSVAVIEDIETGLITTCDASCIQFILDSAKLKMIPILAYLDMIS